MTEPEINKALQVSDTDPLWRAMLQMLEDYREDAITNAATESQLNNSLSTHGYLGGAQLIWNFRKELIDRRETSLRAMHRPQIEQLIEKHLT